MAHLNICSLPSKLDELIVRMTKGKSFDILALSETWLNSNMTNNKINIPGYSCVRNDMWQSGNLLSRRFELCKRFESRFIHFICLLFFQIIKYLHFVYKVQKSRKL